MPSRIETLLRFVQVLTVCLLISCADIQEYPTMHEHESNQDKLAQSGKPTQSKLLSITIRIDKHLFDNALVHVLTQ